MIARFISQTKDLFPYLKGVKKVDHQSDTPLMKLEWCGMQCSGKYGLFIKSEDRGTEKHSDSTHSSVIHSKLHNCIELKNRQDFVLYFIE